MVLVSRAHFLICPRIWERDDGDDERQMCDGHDRMHAFDLRIYSSRIRFWPIPVIRSSMGLELGTRESI